MFKPKLGYRIELHLVKSYAASRLNRDGSNRPKTVEIGGVRRLRISSQSEKSSIRNSDILLQFLEESRLKYGAGRMLRTRRLADFVKTILLEKLRFNGLRTESYEAQINTALKSLPLLFKASNTVSENLETQLISFSDAEIEFIADSIFHKNDMDDIQFLDCKSSLEKIAKTRDSVGTSSPELQLFGRFTTSKAYLKNIDSPLQVNHGFTVHEAKIEQDYWSAVDDFNRLSGNNSGSGHISLRAFGAGVFYFYYCLDVPLLCRNIKAAFKTLEPSQQSKLTQDLIAAVLYSALTRNPTGGQNNHANHNLPILSYVTYGNAFPYSADSAFETPIQADRLGGYSATIKASFSDWIAERKKRYGTFCGYECGMGLGGKKLDLDLQNMIESTIEQVSEIITEKMVYP